MLCIGAMSYGSPWDAAFRTKVFDASLKTFQIFRSDDLLARPIFMLDEGQGVTIEFDELAEEYTDFAYRVIHCDANWVKSSISSLEYISGVDELPIDEFEYSSATNIDYCHYSLTIPNDQLTPRISGNYAVEIFRRDDPDEVVATACFMVVEPSASASLNATTITDIGVNKQHQQLSAFVSYPKLKIGFPQKELIIKVMQNWRTDTSVELQRPYSISSNGVTYQHDQSLLFEAGNEFRRFEASSTRNQGNMGVYELQYHEPYMHVILYQDETRAGKSYLYDEDQNGQYLVRTLDGDDERINADYQLVHFSLESDRIPDGALYLAGDLTNWLYNDQHIMEYNAEAHAYEKTMMLKQGLYNYQYLFVPNGSTKGSPARSEGNHFEAENEYQIFVYYRPMGARYDRLIAFSNVSYKP